MWKAIRNKQRTAYAQGLVDAIEILNREVDQKDFNMGAYHDALEKLLGRYDEVDATYES